MNFGKVAHYFLLTSMLMFSFPAGAAWHEPEWSQPASAAAGWSGAASNLGTSVKDVCYNIVAWPVRAVYNQMPTLSDITALGGPEAARFFSDHRVLLGGLGAAAAVGVYCVVKNYWRVKALKELRDTWIVPLIALGENPQNIGLANGWLGLDDAQFSARIREIESNLGILGVRRGYVWSFVPSVGRTARTFDSFVNELRALRATRTVGDRDRFKIIMAQVDEIVLNSLNSAERDAIKDLAERTRVARLEREAQQRNEQALQIVRHGGGGVSQQQHGPHQQMGAPNIFLNMMPPAYGPPPYYAQHPRYARAGGGPIIEEVPEFGELEQ